MKFYMIIKAYITLVVAIFLTRFQGNDAASFSIDLYHRDSLQFHFNDEHSIANESEIVANLLRRSINRAKTIGLQSVSPEIVPDLGDYLMKLSLGTPPFEILAIADTGSDLIWVQCKPCTCFEQTLPIFEPSLSSTYKPASCSSEACSTFFPFNTSYCNETSNICNYGVHYADGSFSEGDIATETITLGSAEEEKATLPNAIIGCGRNNQGNLGSDSAGVIGLGGGEGSLITQLGSSIQGKFSYCLVPYLGPNTKSSKMHFGDQASVTGVSVVTTPIFTKERKTFYYLSLEGVTVGNVRLNYSDTFSSKADLYQGNMVIDSGSTYTYLPFDLYTQVISEVKKQTNATPIYVPDDEPLQLCYLPTENLNIPVITFNFEGADVKLNNINLLSTTEKSTCVAITQATFEPPIYGNMAQMNFLIGYDLEKKTLSFMPTDCTQQN